MILTTNEIIIVASIVLILTAAIILGVLGGIGMLNNQQNTALTTTSSTTSTTAATTASATTSTTPSNPANDVNVGSLASFSPTNDGKIWTKVFDSMILPSKCFLSTDAIEQISPVSLKKIIKYQIGNNMFPIDNPFKDIVDVPVTGCSQDGTRLILILDLTLYGGINPFRQGDALYIFGINGETVSNTPQTGGQQRYVFATMNEYPKYIQTTNQIMIGSGNPCDSQGTCTLDNSLILFSSGTYTNGGTVRLVGNAKTGPGIILQKPQSMFYFYMAYINNQFAWPFAPITAAQAYNLYNDYFDGYKQWLLNYPLTCTQATYIDNSTAGFVSGPVSVTGGSGSGLQMYIISLNVQVFSIGFLVATNDGIGYKDNDVINITQGSAKSTANISSVNGSCQSQAGSGINGPNGPVYLSYSVTQPQFNSILNYALSIDPTINTIIISSNTSTTFPDNYNNPNMVITFGKTTPDSTFHGSEYIDINLIPICVCNGPPDSISNFSFFSNKISNCAIQEVYTSNTVTAPYDFISNSSAAIGVNCNVQGCLGIKPS